MSEFDSKSDGNFLDMFPTNISLEYIKSIYQYSYDIHFNLIINLTFFSIFSLRNVKGFNSIFSAQRCEQTC